MLKIIFGVFLTLGYTFTAGMQAMVPMQEKKGGLRHMMHLLGLNSFQYFLGLNIADFIICLFPVTLASLILLGFGDIMLQKEIGNFFVVFMFFTITMNNFSYIFSHIFANPETGYKYISLLFSLGLFAGPLIVTSIIVQFTGGRNSSSFVDGFSFWYFGSPLITFALAT